jgi:hypothetical protein
MLSLYGIRDEYIATNLLNENDEQGVDYSWIEPHTAVRRRSARPTGPRLQLLFNFPRGHRSS